MRIVNYDTIYILSNNKRLIFFIVYSICCIFHRRLNEEGDIQPSLEDFNEYLKYLEVKNQMTKFSNPKVTVCNCIRIILMINRESKLNVDYIDENDFIL